MRNKQVNKKSKSSNENKVETDVNNDSRFEQVGISRKFASKSQKKAKIKVDERFQRMFTDEEFATTSAPVDKYGRKTENTKDATVQDLKRFYELENEDASESEKPHEKVTKKRAPKESKSSDNKKGKKKIDEKKARYEYLNRLARGEIDGSSESGDSAQGASDEESEMEDLEDDEQAEIRSEASDIPMGESSKRFAIQNLEWSRLTATDIYAALTSFVPAGGVLKDITVYISQFGEERMAMEDVNGPALFNDETRDCLPSDDEDEDPANMEGSDFNKEKLRKYELSRLKYYFAVATFDSIATANTVYTECDGLEFEKSSIVFDLRFVPDGMQIDRPVRDRAQCVPDDYEAPSFVSKALQSTDVELTWDAEDPLREKLQKWKQSTLSKKGATVISERVLEEFIASDAESLDDSDLEEREEKKKHAQVLRAALLGEDNQSDSEDSSDEEADAAIEPKTTQVKATEPPKNKEGISSAEKPKAKKLPQVQFSDPFFMDPTSKNQRKGNKAKQDKKRGRHNNHMYDEEPELTPEQRREKEAAELELLLLDEKSRKNGKGLDGFDFRAISEGEKLLQKNKGKVKGKGSKRQRKDAAIEAAKADTFKVNTNDTRFASLYQDPDFSIDRTSSQYQDTKAMRELEQAALSKKKSSKEHRAVSSNTNTSGDVTSMINSIKQKAQAFSAKKKK